VRVVPLTRVQRLFPVVLDLGELAIFRGFDASAVALDGPLGELLAGSYSLNVFYPWDV